MNEVIFHQGRAPKLLKDLGEVFSVADLAQHLGKSNQVASVYLARWQHRGWVQRAGPRAGLYHNLGQQTHVAWENKVRALLSRYSAAVLIGESVLHASGWSTQVPHFVRVAVPSNEGLAQIEGFQVVPRSQDWWSKVAPVLLAPESASFSTYGLTALPPAWAVADAWMHADVWRPHVEDLDMEEADLSVVQHAAQSLGAALPPDLR